MTGQSSIPKHKVTRAASLAVTGAIVGVNYLKHKSRQQWRGESDSSRFHEETARATYDVFSKLKGGPLKVAQMLSLDTQLLPQPYVEQFAKAQYTAPPLSYPLVVRSFRREFGKSPTEIFDTFEQVASAGASIGQVHKATIGEKTYAVKVQYPGVAESLDSDLRMVKPIAMKLFKLDAATLDPYIREVRERLLEETDYALELERSMQFAENCRSLANTRFPQYHPDLSSSRILVMDWVDGMHLDQFCKAGATQSERDHIGQVLWDFYHYQIHELRSFHADPHPGNFIVKDGELWVLDFGCVKHLQENFYHDYFALMDPDRIARDEDLDRLLADLGLVFKHDREEDLRKIRPVFRESIELLSRPFQHGSFDFGDETYLNEIRDFGERTRLDKDLQSLQSGRGNAESLYINRAYFGLYNLAGALQARIRTQLPRFLCQSHA
ncbi:MAG: ABC1 kinase family protein [Luteolibacter sp.]